VTAIEMLEPLDAATRVVAELDARAARIETPCGDGQMVWHRWGDGPWLVLLHGGYGSWTHWFRNIPMLAENFTVLAADLPGLGDSDMPPVPYTAESVAAIVTDGIDRIVPVGVQLDLAGFSFGGLIGGHVAARLGTRLRSLTLLGPGGLGLPRAPSPKLRKPVPGFSTEEIAAVHSYNLGAFMIRDPDHIDALAVHLQTENTRRARLKSRPIAATDTLARALRHVTARITAAWGGEDVTAAPYLDSRRNLLRAIQPDCRFEVIPGAGHWVQYEAAERINALLAETAAVD
jgi:pimeloyl-ACP methyl ester carboxylesterase